MAELSAGGGIDRTPGQILVSLLGPVTVSVDGRPAKLNPQLQRLVAALSFPAGQWVPVAILTKCLWDEDKPSLDARKRVPDVIRDLRDALDAVGGHGRGVVQQRSGMYRMAIEPDHVDALRLRGLLAAAQAAAQRHDLEQAAGHYEAATNEWPTGGSVLPGPALTGLDGEWVEGVRTGLEASYFGALAGHLQAGLQLGRHGQLLPAITEVAAADPTNEKFAELQMIAHYRAGQQAAALEVYVRLRRTLDAKLGVQPSGRIERLYQQILNQDPSLDLPTGDQPGGDQPGGNPASGNQGDRANGREAPRGAPNSGQQAGPGTVHNSTVIGTVTGSSGRTVVGSGATYIEHH